MSTYGDLKKKYDALKKTWESRNHADCGKLLEDIKETLPEVALFPNEGRDAEQKDLILVREILEIGAQYSVEQRDIESFERYMAYLKTYYMDYANDLRESVKMYELLGLNLLRLLAQNRLVEFHTELELLPPATLRENAYIAKSVRLEQFIMEGSYNKVIEIRDSVPAESYRVFMDILMDTIRNEIASCMEKSYVDISASECAKMLNLPFEKLDGYAKERNWVISGNKVQFDSKEDLWQSESSVPTKELAKMVLSYAKEMEKIV